MAGCRLSITCRGGWQKRPRGQRRDVAIFSLASASATGRFPYTEALHSLFRRPLPHATPASCGACPNRVLQTTETRRHTLGDQNEAAGAAADGQPGNS
jgi:hypothetical protein